MLHAGVPYNKEFPEKTSCQNINSWFNWRGICMKICVVTPSRYFFRGFISKWHYLQTLLAYDKYISTSFGEIWDRECTLFVVWIGNYTLNHGQITAVWDQNHMRIGCHGNHLFFITILFQKRLWHKIFLNQVFIFTIFPLF